MIVLFYQVINERKKENGSRFFYYTIESHQSMPIWMLDNTPEIFPKIDDIFICLNSLDEEEFIKSNYSTIVYELLKKNLSSCIYVPRLKQKCIVNNDFIKQDCIKLI